MKVVASYTEDQLVTTNPQQLLEIERAEKEFAAKMANAGEATTESESSPLEEELEAADEAVLLEKAEAGEAEAERIRKSLSEL
jgi:hypothetical protein